MELTPELQYLVDDDDNCEIPPLLPYRTVDEILLLYDSSSSNGSPSPPSSPSPSCSSSHLPSSNDNYTTGNLHHGKSTSFSSQLGHLDINDTSNNFNDSHNKKIINSGIISHNNKNSLDSSTAPISRLLSQTHSLDSAFIHPPSISSSTTRFNPTDFSSSMRTLQTPTTVILPSLFTAVKSNVKPGAALAAATAASRSIPTPHAAAIKSSRTTATTIGTLPNSISNSALSPPDADIASKNIYDDNPDNFLSIPGVREGLQKGTDIEEEADSSRLFSSSHHYDHILEEQNVIDQATEAFPTRLVEIDGGGLAGEHMHSSIALAPSNSDSSVEYLDVDENPTATSVVLVDSQDMAVQEEINPTVGHSDDEKTLHVDEMHAQEDVIVHPKDDFWSLSSEVEIADVGQGVSWQWKSNEDSSTNFKSSKISMSPLEAAEELEKKQAFTGLHWEEGAAAQPMRLEGVRRGSTMLGYFHVDSNNTITRTISSSAFRRDHGYPVVLSVHLYYIAIGMSKGIIVVVPSKYSPYHSDNMDAKMFMLGLQGDRSYAPVTSMCFNQQGDFLFAGYGDGHMSVWDVQRASVMKVITEHKAPIVHILYMGQDSQVGKQLNVVSGDIKGVVKLIRFSFFPLVNKISFYKTTVLCDEKMGVVICASSLISSDGIGGAWMTPQGSTGATSAIGSMMGGVIGVDTGLKYSPVADDGVFIFVFHQYALVAKLVPSADNVVKYAHIPRPDCVGEGSMPYASWRFMSDSNGSSNDTVHAEASEKASFLAIAWDRTVQVAKLVKSELKVYGKWSMDSPAVAVAWLDDQMLVILTSIGKLVMFTKDGNMIHETSFSVDISRGDDLITYHTYFNNSYGNPEKAYHNCVAVRGASIYVLGPSHLVVCRLLPWKERIEVLRRAGDWMGALNMAMTLYDGQAHGVIDLPKSLDDIQKTVMPYLVQLLLSYVDEVFSYIRVASGNQLGNSDQLNKSMISSSSDHPEIKEQYIRVGGVAVEFCVHIKRTDILFDEIYTKFDAANHKETFLELLEPYILKDMLGCLPPAIMQALVEHYSIKGWLQRVEQCILHMDISSLDFNQVVRLCREHGLHGALIYLFNKGLDDFRTPLEELWVVLKNSDRKSASTLGYRILVYLKYCFQGLAFPPGHGTLPTTRLLSIREEILQFLLDLSSTPSSRAVANLPSHGRLPNLCNLLQLDTEATLDVLRSAFLEENVPDSNYLGEVSINSRVESIEANALGFESQNLVQKLVDIFSIILETNYYQRGCSTRGDDESLMETWPSKEDAGYMLEFITYYVACERAKVPKDTLSHILEYLTSVFSLSPSDLEQSIETTKKREKQLLALLGIVPSTDWDAPYLLNLCERCQFHQVCGFIHSNRHQYVAALDSYMKALDEPIHAFSFIHVMLQQLGEKESDAFRAAVVARVADLVKLDREGTLFLAICHFYGQIQQVVFSKLQSHLESLFLFMKTLVEVHTTGNLQFSCLIKDGSVYCPNGRRARPQSDRVKIYIEALTDFPKLLRSNPIQLTDEMTELYFELLCRYEQESVRKFLETFEGYRVENCLRLCQEYGIVDAAVFLLERVGEVGSALSLILSGLNEKFIFLDTSIGSGQSDPVSVNFSTVLKKEEVRDILDVVQSCIGLCQRNSPRLDSHESESLWFQLLDSFCFPLMDESLVMQKDEEAFKIKWKISKSLKSSHILRKLLSLFIREIVEGMIGHVPIPTIMLKLISDNRIQEFGDIKPTILGMLGTYDFERRILDTAKSLIEDDTYYTMNLLKKEASHGYAPQDLTCCICNCPLVKHSSIQVFSCGHALHVHCALQEKETSVGAISVGCPICVAGKKDQRSSKTVLVDTGLVSKASSQLQKIPRPSTLHSPDNDAYEASHSSHPVSRFELLKSLQKDQRSTQIESMPPLRLAPPAVYHEKVMKGTDVMQAESISGSSKPEKSSKSTQFREVKANGSSARFPLRSSIFGKEKRSKLPS